MNFKKAYFQRHMLVSLMVPHYVYITDSIEDEWADPDAEFLSGQLASEVLEFYGLKGMVAPKERPKTDEVYREGHIAFYVKSGDHSLTKFDRDNVMNYFEKIIKGEI